MPGEQTAGPLKPLVDGVSAIFECFKKQAPLPDMNLKYRQPGWFLQRTWQFRADDACCGVVEMSPPG